MKRRKEPEVEPAAPEPSKPAEKITVDLQTKPGRDRLLGWVDNAWLESYWKETIRKLMIVIDDRDAKLAQLKDSAQ